MKLSSLSLLLVAAISSPYAFAEECNYNAESGIAVLKVASSIASLTRADRQLMSTYFFKSLTLDFVVTNAGHAKAVKEAGGGFSLRLKCPQENLQRVHAVLCASLSRLGLSSAQATEKLQLAIDSNHLGLLKAYKASDLTPAEVEDIIYKQRDAEREAHLSELQGKSYGQRDAKAAAVDPRLEVAESLSSLDFNTLVANGTLSDYLNLYQGCAK